MDVLVPEERREDLDRFVAELVVAADLPDGKFQSVILHREDLKVTLLRAGKSRDNARRKANQRVNVEGHGHGGLVVEREGDEITVYRSGTWTPYGRFEADSTLWHSPSFRGSLNELRATVKAETILNATPRVRLSSLAERLAA